MLWRGQRDKYYTTGLHCSDHTEDDRRVVGYCRDMCADKQEWSQNRYWTKTNIVHMEFTTDFWATCLHLGLKHRWQHTSQRSRPDQAVRWAKLLQLALAKWLYDTSGRPALTMGDREGPQPRANYVRQILACFENFRSVHSNFLQKKRHYLALSRPQKVLQ